MRTTPSGVLHISRCNSVWLECLLWEQDAAGSSPVTSTNVKRIPIWVSVLFHIGGIRTRLNTTPRWGVACRRLDGGNSSVYSNPSSSANRFEEDGFERAASVVLRAADQNPDDCRWQSYLIFAHTDAKTVRWTVFSPWENPWTCGRTRYGCRRKSIIRCSKVSYPKTSSGSTVTTP